MKKSFMTRVLAVTLSTAMAFSVSSAGNLMTASAAKPYVSLKTKFKTLTIGQKYKMTLKNNSIKWRIKSATSSDKTIVKPYIVKPTYVKLKGKAEGRVKITYKLKTNQRKKNNTKTLKGTVQVKKASTDDPSTTFSATATAADTTSVKITFSQAIDTEGVTAENFAINNDVTVREAKVSEDGKTVDLTIAGATYATEYEVTITGVKVAGEAKDAIKCSFKTPGAAEGYQPVLTVPDKPMKSDGQTTAVLKFELRDSAGNLVEEEGVEVEFTTTLGTFAEPRATLDKGVAENTFTSQSLPSTRTATITAKIIAADNKDLIGQSAIGNIILTPNPEELTDTSIGAIITNAVAPTADRVIAYFQKEVDAKDFQKANGALDESKFSATIKSGVGLSTDDSNATSYKVVGVMAVENEPNALQLLVEKPMRDNTTLSIKFKDKRSTNSVISSENTVYCKLTDGYQPSALKVNVVDNHTLEIEYSEAVLRTADADSLGDNNKNYAADRPENYVIDAQGIKEYWSVEAGESVDENTNDTTADEVISEKFYETNKNTTGGEITVGRYRNGVDKRHIVTIKLGRYLEAGRHSIAISNVGDWAAATDGWRNIINTATVDFEVPTDTNRPSFDLQVMSPEQFKLTANCDIGLVNSNNTFRTEDSAAEGMDVVELQQNVGGQWQTISNHEAGVGYNPIMVSQIRDKVTGALTKEYLVETKSDWTEVCDTKNTRNLYYQNQYRLRIASNSIKNMANGLSNEEIIINLSENPIMKTMDGTSPVIDKIEQATDVNGNLTSNYHVTFSEPIKMNDKANHEGLTPTQGTDGTISPFTAYFVKRDTTQTTVQAKVGVNSFINAEDTMITVKPDSALSGGEWDLYVRGVPDDMGNTAATLSGMITVNQETVTTNFRVVWAAVSEDGTYDKITSGNGHYILVKFNKPIMVSGGSANVGSTLNYTLNGNPLPTGSNITARIKGYDDNVSRVDSITIKLPDGTNNNLGTGTMNYPVNGSSAVLTISNAVTSMEGDTLSTEPGYNLPYHFGESSKYADANDKFIYDTLTPLSDAVWGNAPEEQFEAITKNIPDDEKKVEAYVKAVKEALSNDRYRKVVLDSSELKPDDESATNKLKSLKVDDLTIGRIVDFNMNGCDLVGNVSISTTEAANVVTFENEPQYESKLREATITGKADNEAKDSTFTINAPNTDVVIGDKITIVRNNNSDSSLTVTNVKPETLVARAKFNGNIRLTGSNIGFKVGEGFGFVTPENSNKEWAVYVDSTGTVNVKSAIVVGDATVPFIVTKAGNLVLKDIENTDNFKPQIRVQAAGAKVTLNSNVANVKNITITAEAPNVELIWEPRTGENNEPTLLLNGGSFIQKAQDGNTLPESSQAKPTPTGLQDALKAMPVIKTATPDATGSVEYVTVSALSGGAFFNEADKTLKDSLKDRGFNEVTDSKSKKWTLSDVTVTINKAEFIGYDSTKKNVFIKKEAENITYPRTAETFTVNMKYTGPNDEVKTISRTVSVYIKTKAEAEAGK